MIAEVIHTFLNSVKKAREMNFLSQLIRCLNLSCFSFLYVLTMSVFFIIIYLQGITLKNDGLGQNFYIMSSLYQETSSNLLSTPTLYDVEVAIFLRLHSVHLSMSNSKKKRNDQVYALDPISNQRKVFKRLYLINIWDSLQSEPFEILKIIDRKRKEKWKLRLWQNLPCHPSWQRQRLAPMQTPLRQGRWQRLRCVDLAGGVTSQWSPLKAPTQRHLFTPRHRPPFRHGITHLAVKHVSVHSGILQWPANTYLQPLVSTFTFQFLRRMLQGSKKFEKKTKKPNQQKLDQLSEYRATLHRSVDACK